MPHFFHLSKNEISCWLWTFSALCLCFSPLLFHFTWGNHDWLPLIYDSNLKSGLIEGRFSQYILSNLFLAGKILPILNITLGFLLYTLALILLCTHFFKFTPTDLEDKLFLITIATLPFINEILYFHFITFSLLSWSLFITFSLIAAKNTQTNHYLAHILLSAFLLFIAAGGYPASITMYAVAACLYAANALTTTSHIKDLIRKLSPFVISFILALLPLPCIYNWLKTQNLMISLYNSQTETTLNLFFKIPETLTSSLQSLLQTQPFFPLSFKMLTTLIIFSFCGLLAINYRKKRKLFLFIILIPTLLLTLKLPLWLSYQEANNYFTINDPTAFMVRGDFYSLPTLLLFCLFYIKKHTTIWIRNIFLLITGTLLWLNITLNLSYSKTLILGFKAEDLLQQRITDRIQSHPNYTPNTIYNIIQAGEISLRPRYYTTSPTEKYGYYTLKTPFGRYWTASEHYNFYASQDFAANQVPINLNEITSELITFITNPQTLWPSTSAIYLDNKYCIFSLTPEGKNILSQQLTTLNEQN
ncbi:MAG: glucosyltransferase domain-containing protein [Acetobacter sp.]|nr:glucosyltransferase domain-containing protein [Acetobacter sp.]